MIRFESETLHYLITYSEDYVETLSILRPCWGDILLRAVKGARLKPRILVHFRIWPARIRCDAR